MEQIRVDASINDYLLDIVHATRDSEELRVGVSTRGVLLWNRAAQALALIEGRDYVVPDDAKQLALQVLAHRVMLQSVIPGGDRSAAESVIRQIIDTVPLP